MSKQRLVGLLTVASLIVMLVAYLNFNADHFPTVSPIDIPQAKKPVIRDLEEIKKQMDREFSEEVTEGSPVASSPLQDKAWSLQVGSFSEQENADALVQKLRARGFSAYKKGPRVYVGPVLSRTEALSLKEKILKQEGLESVVVSFRALGEHP